MTKDGIILTENNVIDVFRKLTDNKDISQEEIEQVKMRFQELVNYKK